MKWTNLFKISYDNYNKTHMLNYSQYTKIYKPLKVDRCNPILENITLQDELFSYLMEPFHSVVPKSLQPLLGKFDKNEQTLFLIEIIEPESKSYKNFLNNLKRKINLIDRYKYKKEIEYKTEERYGYIHISNSWQLNNNLVDILKEKISKDNKVWLHSFHCGRYIWYKELNYWLSPIEYYNQYITNELTSPYLELEKHLNEKYKTELNDIFVNEIKLSHKEKFGEWTLNSIYFNLMEKEGDEKFEEFKSKLQKYWKFDLLFLKTLNPTLFYQFYYEFDTFLENYQKKNPFSGIRFENEFKYYFKEDKEKETY